MKKYIFILFVGIFFCTNTQAQTGTAYGFKGGLTLSNQQWNTQERELMPAYHGAFTLESRDEELGVALFGDLGWHVKGSRIVFQKRVFLNPVTNQTVELPRRSIRQPFNNLSVVIGAKKVSQLTDFINYYYGLGAHADYNVSYDVYFGNSDFFDQYVNKFTYGGSVVGGLEYTVGDNGMAFIELSFHPDISKQIEVPQGIPYTDPITFEQRTLGRQEVRNVLVVELSVGYKFVQWNY